MLAFYDNKPSVLEAVGNGSYKYRFDIIEKINEYLIPSNDDNGELELEQRTQWQCQEVIVWPPVTSNKITEAVITDYLGNPNYEQKLINEYNAVKLGLYNTNTPDEAQKYIDKYTEYLNTRIKLKTQVDLDCAKLGIK